MAGKYELYKDKKGEFRFRLKSGNGEIILQSEGYDAEDGALDGIESVKKNSGREEAFEKKGESGGKPYFVLKSSNGKVIGMSETYSSDAARDGGIKSVKDCASGAPVVKSY